MTQPLLSILIPSVFGQRDRNENINNLSMKVSHQIDEEWSVGFLVYYDNKDMTIGEKREYLYSISNGLYSWQIDSDDDISDNAISLIISAIKSNPEVPVITFRESCMMNGIYKSSNHSIIYGQWMDNQDGYDFVRSPFYKDVIRTDLAKSIPFPKIRWNEDEQWSYAIRHLLTSEIHIDEEIYHYIYNETNHNERYGFDKL